MVDQLKPACAPSRSRNSNSLRSSCAGTPHSSSWYRVYTALPSLQGQRIVMAPEVSRSGAVASTLLAQQPEDQAQDDGDDQPRRERKVEAEALTLDADVARQAAQAELGEPGPEQP